jgi:chemotaxis protein methyltransferase CheR
MKPSALQSIKLLRNEEYDLDTSGEDDFLQLITERTGILLHDHQLQSLHTTIDKACLLFGYTSKADYLRALSAGTSLSPQFEFLVSGITVGESYFFRDTAQIELLRDYLLPEIISRKRQAKDYSLRVWSAGCSNGPEIYSLVILLHETLPDLMDWTMHFLATDINSDALTKGIQGHYREWFLRATPKEIKDKYFVQVGNDYVLDKHICDHVQFTYLNLSEDVFPSILSQTQAMDIILCRNVFIYIEPNVVQHIMNRFASCLVPDGLLLLGPSDHMNWTGKTMKYVLYRDTSYFRKLLLLHEMNTDLQTGSISSPEDTPISGNVETLSKEHLKSVIFEKKVAKKTHENIELDLRQIVQMVRDERWQDVLMAVEQAENEVGASAELWQIKGNALANLGQLDASLQACRQSLELNPSDQYTFLIQGIVQLEQGNPQQAELAFRRAIYLDHAFVEAHYYLGLLHLCIGKQNVGLKNLANALALAEQGDPQKELHSLEGMNYRRFAEILRNEISIYRQVSSKFAH